MARARPTLTLQQFYRLPDQDDKVELVRGHVVAEPPPGAQHGIVAARVCFALQDYLHNGGAPGVVLTCDTWFELSSRPATVRGPDVAYIALERYLALDDVRKAVPGAPDLAIEILSPSQNMRALRAKVEDYLDAGAAEVWVIDPAERRVTTYRPGQSPRRFGAADILSAPEVLPGFRVPVPRLLDCAPSTP